MAEHEQELSTSQNRLVVHALDNLKVLVVILDAARSVAYSNPAAREGFGRFIHPLDWTEENGFTFPDPVKHGALRPSPVPAALRGQSFVDVLMQMKNEQCPEGRRFLLMSVPSPDDGVTCCLRDLNEHERQEQRIREASRQRKAILDNIPDMAWLKDREGRFIAVNQRSAEIHNRPVEQWVGLTDFDVYPKPMAERFRADDAEVIRLGARRRVEEKIVTAEGDARWQETIKTPLFDESGLVIGTAGIARDITDRKHEESWLRHNNDELDRRVKLRTRELADAQAALVRRERLAVLGQLAGGVAHQIRNPLGAILNAAAILGRRLAGSQDAEAKEALQIIHEEVRRSNVIITGLLDFARVRAPHRRPTSLPEVVEGALAAEQVPDSIEVHRSFQAGPLLNVDADLIQSAVGNLIRNAVEAMPDGGRLELEIYEQSQSTLLAVSDSGPGINPQLRPHLFEPLHTTKASGVGLGLLTARSFIEADEGTLIYVEVPRGARFEVCLPHR